MSIPVITTLTHYRTEVYIQSRHNFKGKLLICASKEMGLPPDSFLQVVSPLYHILSIGLISYLTYIYNHINHLGMSRETTDPYILFCNEDGHLRGANVLQVDKTLSFWDADFVRL